MTRHHRILWRGLLGACLLLGVLWLAKPGAVWVDLRRAQPLWLGLGLLLAVASNVVSALRWRALTRWLGNPLSVADALRWYFQAIGLNALLPGAVLGGDVYRAVVLTRSGASAPSASLAVILDRVSGLWMLCALGGVGAVLCAPVLAPELGWSRLTFSTWVGLATLGWLALPWLAPPVSHRIRWPHAITRRPGACRTLAIVASRVGKRGQFCSISRRIVGLRNEKAGKNGLLLPPAQQIAPKSDRLPGGWRALLGRPDYRHQLVWQTVLSAAVQLLSAAALAAGALALGVRQPYGVWLFVSAPIFLMAALPVSVGGWGTREAAAVAALATFGVAASAAVGIGLVYGAYALAQGVMGALAFGLPKRAQ